MTQAQPASQEWKQWRQIVDRVTSAPDQAEFLDAMLELQISIVAGRYGTIWVIDETGKPHLSKAWPTELAKAPLTAPVMKMLADGASRALQRSASQVLKINLDEPDKAQDAGTHLFVTLMRHNGKPVAVSTVVADFRDDRAAAAAGPLRELAASLCEGFFTKAHAQGLEEEARSIRQAMALLAVAQEGRGFNGACMNLVNELARQHNCTRVCLGWIRGHAVRAIAISGTEHFKRHSEQITAVELAMAECLDQQQPILYPLPPNAEPLLAEAVVHDHRRLVDHHPNLQALSIPLRNGEHWVGVLTLEKPTPSDSDTSFTPQAIHRLQLVGDVLGPYLADRRGHDRFLVVHAWHSFCDAWSYLLGPKHVGWKLLAVLLLGLLCYGIFGTWQYRVSAPFVLEAQSKRILPTPYEGRLEAVFVEPGKYVKAQQPLAKLHDTELVLQLTEAQSQLKLARLEHAKATAENKHADAQQALARAEQIQARINLLEHQINQSTIRSPIEGVVLSGYWHDKVGGVIEQGKPMFEVAPLEDLIALVRVSESDINEIDPVELPSGEMATRSEPEIEFDIHVNRIVPLAAPIEGSNVFELRCRIDKPANWLRPGMEGLAQIDVENRNIIWILTHKIIDTVRLWLWWWW